MAKNRLEAFSDAVLAIAITPLVIELRPPEIGDGETLPTPCGTSGPAYMVSFLIIGVGWLNHHRIFQQVHRVDGLLRYMVGTVTYCTALALAFVAPPLALSLHGATALYCAFDQASVPAEPHGSSSPASTRFKDRR